MKTILRSFSTAALLTLTALAAPGCVGSPDTNADTGDEQDVTQTTGHFETFQGLDSKYYFQLIASNGTPLLRSDAYTTLASAKKGITAAQKAGAVTAQFHVLATDDGGAYFNLVASNGQLLAMSDAYASKANATKGVDAVVRTIGTASTAAAASGAKFETLKGDDGKYYFQLRAENGRVVLTSDGYSSKSAADKGTTSVLTAGLDATHFDLGLGDGDQNFFRILATNKNVLARSEVYVSKSNAIDGAAAVRALIRKLAGVGALTDAEIQSEIVTASNGLLYTSESDYPFEYVTAPLGTSSITQAYVQSHLASYTDNDPNADKPLSKLYGMSATWETWKSEKHNCADLEEGETSTSCDQMRNLEQVLESNLTDIHVYYFGKNGAAGNVQGIGVSVFIVGKAPSGNLVGVRTLAIWT